MAFQSPLISIPKKTTNEVDWSTPIRNIIAQSFGEDPKTYAEEISVLQRCRQDAVKGAGSDQTGRDLLYKYFGQLELLELRFAEIKVAFIWNDAFTSKPTTQTSLAFEKASIIHLLASVLSTLASGASRSDPEALKRAYYNSRATAGMLTYINDNFLHAPSTDLSREVIHFLIGLNMAQATEIFTEKLVDEKKSPALISRSANTAAGMYAALIEEMKDFQGKGIFDRNWLSVISIKAKLFASVAQYYKSLADAQGGKHGVGLIRMKLADTLAQDAQRQASVFTYAFVSTATPSLPADSATSLSEITKANATLCSEAKAQGVKDNDLIYHDILPSEASLPAIEKLPTAAPITIQEVYGNAEVSKLIGPDIFGRLIPLAVHESASVYSEEKAKLVRGEVERVDLSEGEVRAGLEHLGLPGVVSTWSRLAEDEDDGEGDIEVGREVIRLAREVEREGSGLESRLRGLEGERERCEKELRDLSSKLDGESRECERMRAKYAPQFTQSPSGPQTSHLRSNISSNLNALSAAASSDSNISAIFREIQPDIAILSSGETSLREIARKVAAGKVASGPDPSISLLDLDEEVGSKSGLEDNEKEELKRATGDARDRLDRLSKIRRERDEVLKDLKEKIQNDDVSSLLLLNRRSGNVEPQLFASELEKFRPYQSRLAAAIQACKSILQELEMLVRQIERGKGVKERQRGAKDRQRRLRDWERKLEFSGEQFAAVQAGYSKGMSYYQSLGDVIDQLNREVGGFLRGRESERNRMVSDVEMRQRLAGSAPPPPAAPGIRSLEAQLSGMSLGGASSGYAPSPPPSSRYAATPAMPAPPTHPPTPSYMPPPPRQAASSPYDFTDTGNFGSAFSTGPSTSSYPSAPQQPEPPRQPSYSSNSQTYPSYSSSTSSPYPPPPPLTQASRPPQPPSAYPSHTPSQYASQHSSTSYQPPQPPSHYASPPPPTYPAPPPKQPYYNQAPPASSPYHSASPPPPSQYPSYAPSQPAYSHNQQSYQPPQPPQQPQYGGYNSPPPPPPTTGQYGMYGQQQPQQQQQGYQYR